nr:hypothetical protein [Micromonospora sp. DSM 115978]
MATDLAVLPGLQALPPDAATRLAVRAASYAWDPAGLLAPLLRDAVLAAGLRSRRQGWLGWTTLAAALSALQPAVVAAGKIDVAPGQLPVDALARRRLLVAALADLAGTAPTPPPSGVVDPGAPAVEHRPRRQLRLPPRTVLDDLPARRRAYADDLTAGVERFLEAPRLTCPWCGSARLRALFEGGDALMAKPGRFRYDRCEACAHVFQNPRLSLDGLDFYYRDAYDGAGAELVEEVFAVNDAYLSRARLPLPSPPKRWLDVGGGLGHFCNVARDVWP